LFIDTTGNFRPERIQEISKGQGEKGVLGKISYIRVFNSSDQNNIICGASERSPKIIIVDNVTSLISNEFGGARKHLRIMKHMHSLCLTAITLDCAVVVTNMLTYSSNEGSLQEGESLASSISLCAHVRARLEIANFTKLIYKATLLQPAASKSSFFGIRKTGITDA
jgi:hypothetical protein